MRESLIELLFDDECASAVRYDNDEVAIAWKAGCPVESIWLAFQAAKAAGAVRHVQRAWTDDDGTQHFILA